MQIRSRWSALSASGLVISALGCGGSAQPAETATDPASGAATASASPALPALEPAAAPAGLVFKLRVANVEKLIDGTLEGASIPLNLKGGLAALERTLHDGWPPGVDLSLPLEAVVALNSDVRHEPYSVLSVGVRDVSAFARELERRNLDPQEGPGGTYYFTYERQPCALGRALGPSPARVVCSASYEGLHELLPYALRGLPAETLSKADVHFDFDMRPVRAAYGRQVRSLKLLASVGARQFHLDEPRFDRALSDIAVGLAEELGALSQDLDEAHGRLTEEHGDFSGELSVRFGGESSWTVHSLGAWARTVAPAPPLFDQLPATASSASYARPLPAEKLGSMRQMFVDLSAGYASSEKLSAPLVKRIEKLAQDIFYLDTAPTVQATGPLVLRKSGKDDALLPAWQLWGSSRPATQVTGLLGEAESLFASAEFKKWVEDPRWVPMLKKQPGGLRGIAGATVYRWQLPLALTDIDHGKLRRALDAPANLGEFEELAGAASPFASWAEGYLAVASLDGVTWVAFGQDLDRLTEPLVALGNKQTARLGDVAELRAFRAHPANGAAFFQVSAAVGTLAPYLPQSFVTAFPALLDSTPYKGKVPATYFVDVQRTSTTEFRMTWQMPKGFLTDAATLIVLGAAESKEKK